MLRNRLNGNLSPAKAANLKRKLAIGNSFETVAREWYN